jgi:hypothetical protein
MEQINKEQRSFQDTSANTAVPETPYFYVHAMKLWGGGTQDRKLPVILPRRIRKSLPCKLRLCAD